MSSIWYRAAAHRTFSKAFIYPWPTGGLAGDAGLLAALQEKLDGQKSGARIISHEHSIFAGAIGAGLWGAFRYDKPLLRRALHITFYIFLMLISSFRMPSASVFWEAVCLPALDDRNSLLESNQRVHQNQPATPCQRTDENEKRLSDSGGWPRNH